ncbi:hypothetical protein GLYMA_19G041450v4 [Glycine max]|nr:hypothetical protein GLYMA_19G041450v4 [Glycine max]KAH1076337.1 hypothetical protein GYH30_052003 [Glycine max]
MADLHNTRELRMKELFKVFFFFLFFNFFYRLSPFLFINIFSLPMHFNFFFLILLFPGMLSHLSRIFSIKIICGRYNKNPFLYTIQSFHLFLIIYLYIHHNFCIFFPFSFNFFFLFHSFLLMSFFL